MSPVRSFSLGAARRITALLALLLSALYVTNAWQTLSVGRWHKPGAAIFCIAQKKADGSLTAARITAEKDGVKPPM